MPGPINWEDFGVRHEHFLPTNWEILVDLDVGSAADRTIFRGFWSPSSCRYFWHGTTGGDRTHWGDGLRSQFDLHAGTALELTAGLRSFIEDHHVNVTAEEALAAHGALDLPAAG